MPPIHATLTARPKNSIVLSDNISRPEICGTRERMIFVMLKEITQKTKEEVSVSQGFIALVAIIAFVAGLVIGILASPKRKKSRASAADFDSAEYVKSLNFDDFDGDFVLDSGKEEIQF